MFMKEEIRKTSRGITLVALVITIIILLILAGISISSLTGNGLFPKAEIAKENTRGANVKEQVELWKIEKKTNEYDNSLNTKTEKELLDDLELNQKLLTNKERNDLEIERKVTIGNQAITLDDEIEVSTVTNVYAKLYSYNDGTEGYKIELANNVEYINNDLNLIDDFENKDINNLERIPWTSYNVKTIEIINEIVPIDVGYFSRNMELENIIGLKNLNTSNVTDMSGMFCDCRKLKSLDLSNFDTSNVTNMNSMFRSCGSWGDLKVLDLSSFDTSKVTDMEWMFAGCSTVTDIKLSSFITKNVEIMSFMFRYCSLEKLDLSSFDTSRVTDMTEMFFCSSGLTEILVNSSTWNVEGVETSRMFMGCGVSSVTYKK